MSNYNTLSKEYFIYQMALVIIFAIFLKKEKIEMKYNQKDIYKLYN